MYTHTHTRTPSVCVSLSLSHSHTQLSHAHSYIVATDTALTFVGEKHRDTLSLSVLSSLVKRAVSIGVGEVWVCAVLQELLQQGYVVVKYGLGQDI